MSPFIQDGDVVTLKPFDGAACALGDVVAFVRPQSERMVVHRIVSVQKGCCHIQGDNNPEEDDALPYSAIIGRVARVERAGKDVRFGLGPERVFIAALSRRRWLLRGIHMARVLRSIVVRKS
jgi:signal peptidase I